MSDKQPIKLDDEQIAELREIFRSFDRNNDGSLTQLELGSLLRSLGLKPSPDQLENLIMKADTNSNGLVEFSEFVALAEPELWQQFEHEKLRCVPVNLFAVTGNKQQMGNIWTADDCNQHDDLVKKLKMVYGLSFEC
ncbi:putative calcium-binding protein CML17, partial [Cucurbita argyrosperma subsp. argyrosperma]